MMEQANQDLSRTLIELAISMSRPFHLASLPNVQVVKFEQGPLGT